MSGETSLRCGACGADVTPGARFCHSCGQPLVLRGDERRVVTVLFADLVGFTRLAERRDPEQVKNLVDRCFERLAADIADFGGRVDKVLGDGLVALFGAPVAHEDDAERAVRAGLRMQQTVAAWAAANGVEGLRMRVGINTGEVLVGSLRADGDWTVMGDVVNTASRLQTLAEPGAVVVGPETHAATATAVRYTPLGPVQARGREAPVEAWVAEEAVVPPGRRARRRDVPLVGRGRELALLGAVVEGAARGRSANVVVVAEAGMGKTRLVEEVAERAARDHGAAVLVGRCVPYGEANVWWPVADALRSSFGVPIGTAAGETRSLCVEKVREALDGAREEEVERVAEGLLHLLGEPGPLSAIDPARAREEVIRAITAYVSGWARRGLVVVVLTDLHWADDAVLELIDALGERAGLPFVLLATARSTLLERWRPAPGRHDQVILHLDPLDRQAASELLDHLGVDVSAELRELVLDRSGGNPFFLEELVALLGEGGGRTGVPHTLRGLVAARLDALPEAERAVLDDAAILGRRFPAYGIRTMAEKVHGLDAETVDAALDALVAKDLLVAEGDAYSFRSDLVREVAYRTLTKAARIKGHVGVASWIETHPTGSAADVDRIAHHLATAASLQLEVGHVDDTPADLPARALAALDRAIAAAEASELHRVALRLATQACDLADATDLAPAERLRFLLSKVRAETALRRVDDAETDLKAADELAAATGDPTDAARVLLRRGELQQKGGDPATAVGTLGRAIEAFRAAGDRRGFADALLAAGMCHLFLGEEREARERFLEALDAFRDLGDRRGEGWALQNLAWVAFASGRIADADDSCEESIAIFRELGDRGGLAWAIGMQAFVRFHQGRFDEADELSSGLLGDAEEMGDPWAIGMMHCLRASLRLWTGRSREAVDHAQEALRRFRAMDDWYGQLLSLGVLARSLLVLGRFDDAFEAIDRGVEVARDVVSREASEIAWTLAATTAAQAGRPDRCDPGAVGIVDPTEPVDGFSDGTVAAGLLQLQRGDVAGARRTLEAVAAALGDDANGYVWSSLALVRVAGGDLDGACRAAATAAGRGSSTYADRTAAALAELFAAARTGDAEAADAALGRARAALEGTEDRLGRSLVSLAAAHAGAVLGQPGARTGVAAEAAADCPGWDRAFRLAAGG